MRGVYVVLVPVLAWVGFILWYAPIALLFSLPWIAAALWIAYRGGWDLLRARGKDQDPQSQQLRSFGAR